MRSCGSGLRGTGLNAASCAMPGRSSRSYADDASVIFTTFSDSVRVGERQRKKALLTDLDSYRHAEGMTALFDAIIAVAQHTEAHPSEKLTIVIVTDGEDTCSHHGVARAKASIEAIKGKPNHHIVYMGSNQDAVLTGGSLGIPVRSCLTYGQSTGSMQMAFQSATEYVTSVRSAPPGTCHSFTEAQRVASVYTEIHLVSLKFFIRSERRCVFSQVVVSYRDQIKSTQAVTDRHSQEKGLTGRFAFTQSHTKTQR